MTQERKFKLSVGEIFLNEQSASSTLIKANKALFAMEQLKRDAKKLPMSAPLREESIKKCVKNIKGIRKDIIILENFLREKK